MGFSRADSFKSYQEAGALSMFTFLAFMMLWQSNLAVPAW